MRHPDVVRVCTETASSSGTTPSRMPTSRPSGWELRLQLGLTDNALAGRPVAPPAARSGRPTRRSPQPTRSNRWTRSKKSPVGLRRRAHRLRRRGLAAAGVDEIVAAATPRATEAGSSVARRWRRPLADGSRHRAWSRVPREGLRVRHRLRAAGACPRAEVPAEGGTLRGQLLIGTLSRRALDDHVLAWFLLVVAVLFGEVVLLLVFARRHVAASGASPSGRFTLPSRSSSRRTTRPSASSARCAPWSRATTRLRGHRRRRRLDRRHRRDRRGGLGLRR